MQPTPPGAWPMLLDHPPTWLCSPNPGHPERVEGGGRTPGRCPRRPGRVSEAGGRRPARPRGGRLRVGAVLRGLGTRRTHQRWEPPSKHEFGCSDTPSHQTPSWRRPEGPGAWPGQVLTRCWGAPRGRQSHTLIAERGGDRDLCTCEHARACIRAHTCTCTHASPRASQGPRQKGIQRPNCGYLPPTLPCLLCLGSEPPESQPPQGHLEPRTKLLREMP